MKHSTTSDSRRWVRVTAVVAAVAVLAGCASPFHFSKRMDTYLPPAGGEAPAKEKKLAGDLHLSLAALQEQRQLLWQAAGETETMKNATALLLIGGASAGIYRGLRGEESKGWLQRAGLIGGALFTGATFLEPTARQKIYLQGSASLSCLALATAPYEMPQGDYDKIREHIAGARIGVEKLASALRFAGRYDRNSETWWLVRGGWNKLRWASEVLESADAALGNVERAGPRLRDMTAMLASDVAHQVNEVTKSLEKLPDAILALKPNANLILGQTIFELPAKESKDSDPPGTSNENPKDDDKKGDGDTAAEGGCKAAAAPKASPDATKKAEAAAVAANAAASAASAAASAASAAAADVRKVLLNAQGQATVAAAATAAARAAEIDAQAKLERQRQRADREAAEAAGKAAEKAADKPRAEQLRKALEAAVAQLDPHLGPVASFVERIASARRALALPKGCGEQSTIEFVPAKRNVVLQPGESFQIVVQGDAGRARADFLGNTVGREVLDLSMPLTQSSTSVRMTAGTAVPKAVNTVVRITDSKGQQNFDVNVKVCPAS